MKAKDTTPIVCPKCGNTSHDKGTGRGITHCYLEWRIAPVVGVDDADVVLVDFDNGESVDVANEVVTTMTNTPNVEPDLRHLFCNRCDWCWHDPRPFDD